MPASVIVRALEERVPEPILAWCNGQSLESRYSSSVGGGVGGIGRAGGAAILRHQHNKGLREDAEPMPRFPVVATTADRIYIFAMPINADAVAVLDRGTCSSSTSGKGMWRRLDIVNEGPPARSYAIYFNVLFGSRRRIHGLLRSLHAEA